MFNHKSGKFFQGFLWGLGRDYLWLTSSTFIGRLKTLGTFSVQMGVLTARQV